MKSGYRVACLLNQISSNPSRGEGWVKLWKIPVPPKIKIKIFLWRLCSGILPTRLQLLHKNLTIPLTCVLCGNDVEHEWHVFLECPFAQACWAVADLIISPALFETVGEWYLQLLSSCTSSYNISINTIDNCRKSNFIHLAK